MNDILKLFRKGKKVEVGDSNTTVALYIKNLSKIDELEKEDTLDKIRVEAEKHFDESISSSYKKSFENTKVEEIAAVYVNNTYNQNFMNEIAMEMVNSGVDDFEKITDEIRKRLNKEMLSKEYSKKIQKQIQDLVMTGKDNVLNLLIDDIRKRACDVKVDIWKKAVTVYYSCYKDEEYREKYFESYKQVMEADALVIEKLYSEYQDLLLTKTELKKNNIESDSKGDDGGVKVVQRSNMG